MAIKRILHILNTLDIGGAEALTLALAGAIDRERFEMTVCSLGDDGALGPEFRAIGVPTLVLRRRPGIDLRLCLRLIRLAVRNRIDILHSHNAAPWFYGGLAAFVMRRPLVHTEHSNLFAHQKNLMRAERALSHMTAAVVADSHKVGRHLQNTQGIADHQITTIANGIDADAFFVPGNRTALRGVLGIPENAIVVGSVGRLVDVKNQRLLLDAFDLMAGQRPRLHLLLVGDGPLRASLHAQASRLQSADRIHLPGSRRDVAQMLGAMDVFALSSKSEGLPLTVLEAMAAGLPVVATDVGALNEAVVAGKTGLLVPPNNTQALTDALMTLVDNEDWRRDLGRQGRQRVLEDFSIAQMAARYQNIYDHVLTG